MTLRADEVQPGDYVLGACPRGSEWVRVEESRPARGPRGAWAIFGRVTGHTDRAHALRLLPSTRFVRVLRPRLPDE